MKQSKLIRQNAETSHFTVKRRRRNNHFKHARTMNVHRSSPPEGTQLAMYLTQSQHN